MSATVTAAEINTPLVGTTIFTNGVPEGQNEAESFVNDTIALATITPSVTGGSGNLGYGDGGTATLTLLNDMLQPGAGLGVTLTASTVGGAGGTEGNNGYEEISGRPGGAAVTNLSALTVEAAAPTTLTLVAKGGASGGGTGGASATASLTGSTIDVAGDLPVAGLEIQLEATGSDGGDDDTSQDSGFPGGAGGGAAVTLSGNAIAAASVALSLNATGGAGGPNLPYSISQGGASAEPSGTTTVVMTDNQVSLTAANGTLDLSLDGEAVTFSGNSLQGGGASTLVLSPATGSYAIDTASGTIAIDGPGANTLAGFTTFDASGVASGDNTFSVGSANQELELGSGFTTVTVTPGSGDLTITGATQSNLVLDFEDFGLNLTTLAQLLADVSTPTANTETISLPNGQTITLEGTPISFDRLNVVVPDNGALPPPPTNNLPASAINTPVVGASGSSTEGGQNGQSATAVFDRELFTQADLSPSALGGAGLAFVGSVDTYDDFETFIGAGGAASLELQNDIVGAGGDGDIVLNAGATGGQGPSAPYGTTANGGHGGDATILLDGITEANGNAAALALRASGGSGGPGQEGVLSGSGGAAGSAAATLTNSTLDVSGGGALTIDLAAVGGAGGIGGSGPYSSSYGNGGAGGSASAELMGNALSAADVELGVVAAVAAAAMPGSSTAVPVYGYSPPPGSGVAGIVGTAALIVTNNQVAVDAPDGTLSLSLGAPNAPAGLTGALTFIGNSFTGENDSTFDLSLSSGSYAIDAASGTITIAGSAANALSGFDVFDAVGVTSGNNSFTAGSAAATIEVGGGTTTIQLGSAVTTVLITPQAGNIDLVSATASNVVLEFRGFGIALDSLEQLAADTSDVSGAEQITLPDGSTVAIVGTPIPLYAADVNFVGSSPNFAAVTVGMGGSKLSLFLSDGGQSEQFAISIDGTEVGGVQTISADGGLGEEQEFDVLGDFTPGSHAVTINLLVGAATPLSVESAAFDGTPLATVTPMLAPASAATFGFTADGSLSPVTLGFGPDTLALAVAERAEPAGAQFIISVDGMQVGGIQTTVADLASGGFQTFDVLGDFADGKHTVTIDYLNADNSLLAVDTASINGAPIASSAVTLSNTGTATFGFDATGSLTPVVVGTGPDTLVLVLSQRGQPLGAQFTVSVNGTQIGGVQATLADATAGQSQEFDIFGDFGTGSTVSIDYLNADNSLLTIENATINGAAIPGSALVLDNDGAGGFGFNGPTPGTVDIGAGADTLVLTVAQRGEPAGALFTIDVDGAQIGGVQSVSSNSALGQSQPIDVRGNFAAGSNTATVSYLNPDNSLLLVEAATFDGAAVSGSAVTLSNQGSATFEFAGVAAPAGAVALGNGPDQLALVLAERDQPVGAEFTVDVDGTQIGGVQVVTADSTAGQTQTFDVFGAYSPGSHTVSVNYLNADNSLLLLDSAALNGATISGAPQTLSNVGSQGFTFLAPSAPGAALVNTAPDTLVLNLSEDYLSANAQFTIAVDGLQVGGVQTTTAIHGSGQSQAFDITGSFSGQHTVALTFLNAASSGGLAGTLYLGGATLDGTALPGSTLTLASDGVKSFTFSH